jgi:hypothetical protein
MLRKLLPAIAGAAIFILLTAIGAVVYAQGDVEPLVEPVLASRVAALAFQIVTPIVTILATWLAHRIVSLIEKKAGIDVPDKQEAMIDKWIAEGIHLAEEWSYKKVKDRADKLKGSEKLEAAGDYVMDLVAARGWDNWTRDRVVSKLESLIGTKRANGGKPTLDDVDLVDDEDDED